MLQVPVQEKNRTFMIISHYKECEGMGIKIFGEKLKVFKRCLSNQMLRITLIQLCTSQVKVDKYQTL